MDKALARVLVLLMAFVQSDSVPRPAVNVSFVTLTGELRKADASGKSSVTDVSMRTVNLGTYNVAVAAVYRPKGAGGGAASHDQVDEVYQVLGGMGTLVTGGEIINPKRRSNTQVEVAQKSGPGISGTALRGGVSREISRGDIVVIPAGTPHWFSEIREPLTYSVIRIDPDRILPLK